jgi:hypothetical protein
MINRRRWLTAFTALALAVLAAGTALGYAGEVAASVTVSRPSGTLKCGVNITISATVLDATGKPIAGQPVAWSWVSRVSRNDSISKTPTTTNASGVAKTTVKLACVPGSRVLRATADAVKGQAVLNVTAGGLPRTSTLAAGVPGSSESILGTLLAVLALVAGGGLAVRGALARR